MKILLTNDDGIDAPGLAALRRLASALGQVVTVAPREEQSGCGHRVTTGSPIRVQAVGPDSFVVDGTPADCVRIGLHDLARDADWVLAGINDGGNLGADVYHSVTVAAVREGWLHRRPGIAVSHYHLRGQIIDWDRAVNLLADLIANLLQRPAELRRVWNVNLPHPEAAAAVPQVVFCPLDPEPLPLAFESDGEHWHYRGNYHGRRRQPGSDVDVCFGGGIAVTELVVSI